MEPLSLSKVTKRFVAVVFAFIVLMTWLIVYLLDHHSSNYEQRVLEANAKTYAAVISKEIDSYNHFLINISRRRELVDLLLIGDEDDIMDWTLEHNGYLPHNLGLALVSKDKQIFGDPIAQRVGSSCVADLLKDNHEHWPPFHADIRELAHFDLTVPVTDFGGEKLGLLFASFTVDTLVRALKHMSPEDHVIELFTANNMLIARSNKRGNVGEFLEYAVPVPDTTWELRLTIPKFEAHNYFSLILIASLVLALILGVSILLLFGRSMSGVLAEIDMVTKQFQYIADGTFKGYSVETRYKETRRIGQLAERISSMLHKQQEDLKLLSATDELTGLNNRRKFMDELDRAWFMADRGVSVGLVLIDIDHFKQLNDSEGHKAGDVALQLLAQALKKEQRKTDVFARLGGDEFVGLFIDADPKGLHDWFERLQQTYMELQADNDVLSGDHICSISAGAAYIDTEIDIDPDSVIQRVDKQLYEAKQLGRDCIRSTK